MKSYHSILTDYPVLGFPRTNYTDDLYPTPANQVNPLLSLTTGSGVVRGMWMTGSTGTASWADFGKYEIRIYADGESSPYSATPVRIPLGILMNDWAFAVDGDHPTRGPLFTAGSAVPIVTPFYDLMQATDIGGHVVMQLQLKFPIPFSNGILIETWDMTGTPAPVAANTGKIAPYFWVGYELGTIPTDFAAWRLRGSFIRGVQVSKSNTSTQFMSVAAGTAGTMLGLWANVGPGAWGDAASVWQRGRWGFAQPGSSSPEWLSPGGVGGGGALFNNGWAHQVWANEKLPDFGITGNDGYGNIGQFRLWPWDSLNWTDGLVGTFTNADVDNADIVGTNCHVLDVLALYYADH